MGSSKSPQVTQASTMTGPQKNFLNSITKAATKGAKTGESGLSGVSAYPGQQVSAATPLLQSEFGTADSLLSGTNAVQNQSINALSGLEKPFDSTQSGQNWQKAVGDPSMQNWNQNLMPQLMEQFAGANAAGGGNAAKTVTDSATNLQTGMASSLGNWQQTAEQNSNSNLLKAAGLTSQIPGQNIKDTQGIASDEYGISQANLDASMKNWQTEQPYNNPWISIGTGQEGAQSFENVVSSSVGQELTGKMMGAIPQAPSCCFIFMEANGGSLDPFVREYRDKLMTQKNKRGYYRISEKLVPWMRRSRVVAEVVKCFMVNPMLESGRWYKERRGFPVFSLMVGFFWMIAYDLMGAGKPYQRSNGEWV
jgi:hypothetical protein